MSPAGIPKAAVIAQRRLWAMALFSSICGVKSDDVYICLPLYHSAGFAIGFSGAIERGMFFILFCVGNPKCLFCFCACVALMDVDLA